MNRAKYKQIALCILVLCGLLFGCSKSEEPQNTVKNSVFSWQEEYLKKDKESDINKVMERLECEAIYQSIPIGTDTSLLQDYMTRRKEQNQDVYWLAGEPNWATQMDSRGMLNQVKQVASWNQNAENDETFTGIVWDVEPYLLDQWKTNKKRMMKQFLLNCKAAYKQASKENLEVIVCIPYFYDTQGFKKELKDLIQNGCDTIAVMNYYKKEEEKHIATEVNLAEQYDKGILNIAELQKPGVDGIVDENTYYEDGITAVEDSFHRLREAYTYDKLGFSWHYMDSILEVLGREEDG